jgi:hypothetical protein
MAEPTQPTALPEWATGGSAEVTEPLAGKKSLGWIGEKPPHEIMNWLHLTVYQWLMFFKTRLEHMIGMTADTTLTVASNIITPTHGSHKVANEGGYSQDEITNIAITDMDEGRLLLLRPASADAVTILKYNAGGDGSIILKDRGDLMLYGIYNSILLKRIGVNWYEITRTFGAPYLIGRGAWVPLMQTTFNLPRQTWNGKSGAPGSWNQYGKPCFDGQDSIWCPGSFSLRRFNVFTGASNTINLGGMGSATANNVCIFDGSHIWTLDTSIHKALIKINRTTETIDASVDLTAMTGVPFALCFDGTFVWVASQGGSLYKVDPRTNTVVGSASIAASITSRTIGWDGTNLYLGYNADVKKYSTSGGLLATIPTNVGGTWASADLIFDGVYMWNAGSTGGVTGQLQKIDVQSNTLIAQVAMGGDLYQACFDGLFLWATRRDAAELKKVDPQTNAVVATITTPWAINGDMTIFDGNNIWAGSSTNGQVQRYLAR